MFQRLMIPLDGSKTAECALPWAERFAAMDGVVLHLVRIVEPPVRATWVPGPVFVAVRAYDDPVERATLQAITYLDGVRGPLVAAGAAVEMAHPVGTSGAGPALLAYERAAAIDLVVMGSHGRGGVTRFALGSVATHLLRHGTAPLLLVRPATAALPVCRAIVPLDGSPQSEEALYLAAELHGSLVQDMALLRVVGGPHEVAEAQRYLDAVRRRLCDEGGRQESTCTTHVAQGDPATVIMAVAGTEALVVMGTRGRSALTRWAMGSVADRVARQGAAPVLLVRGHGGADQ